MAHLFQSGRVRILCSCGILRPIISIYFCRHCLKMRCGNCVSHEVDTLYCPNCLENMPSPEAKLKKNRCNSCFDCPCCGQMLATRATSVQVAVTDEAGKLVPRKMYYLACTSCRWTSRDGNLPDQAVATGGWAEEDNPNYKRLQDLQEHYRFLAQLEKAELERKRFSSRKSAFLSLTEKYSSPGGGSGRKSLSSLTSFSPRLGKSLDKVPKMPVSEVSLVPAEASQLVEGLDEDIFHRPLDICSITTLEQRLASPEFQISETQKLLPLHKHVLMKRSVRCRHCEHNLSKPEYNPSSIKFKIQLAAFYHVPEVRMVKEVEMKSGVQCSVQLTLCNPTPHDMPVELLPFVHEEFISHSLKEEVAEVEKGLSSLSSTVRLIELPMEITDVDMTADIILPQRQLVLAARDDTAEYEDSSSSSKFKDDPKVVPWRKGNKVCINVLVTPRAGHRNARIGFVIRYDYTNTVATAMESRVATINIPVFVDLGLVSDWVSEC